MTINRFRPFGPREVAAHGLFDRIPPELRFEFDVVSRVLPFRVNQYVVDELIDWSRVPEDPVYQSLFPHRDMLPRFAFEQVAKAMGDRSDPSALTGIVERVRRSLNPHPAGQTTENVARMGDSPIEGFQHKYRETVLFFPPQAQTCHSFCAYCFRWPQFVGREMRMQAKGVDPLLRYLKENSDVSDLLVTGGDPMVMKAAKLSQYLLPLCGPEYSHVQNIRIGTKSLSFWPHRFVTDSDADDLLRLLESLVSAGKHVAIMAHISHGQEMAPEIFARAVERIRRTGAIIRSQAPILAHINDTAESWAGMWKRQVHLGIVPYYMFVERNTGAFRYFELPLVKTWKVYREAMAQVSGLARTARGPTMSCRPGKIEIQGVTEAAGKRVFVLRFIQARESGWVEQPFFAKYDPKATWYDQLEPAFGERSFFFETSSGRECLKRRSAGVSVLGASMLS